MHSALWSAEDWLAVACPEIWFCPTAKPVVGEDWTFITVLKKTNAIRMIAIAMNASDIKCSIFILFQPPCVLIP